MHFNSEKLLLETTKANQAGYQMRNMTFIFTVE